jgi:energy-coupling factor transporter ATP-binding protein EcfA2
MRVIQLKAENIKRLSAIDITPGEGSLITIAGKNDQGKSSVIDAIAMALGGKALTPKQPIKGDATRGEVFVDLGAYKVTRVFTRSRAACDCENGEGATQHLASCASQTKWGEITSTLTVKSAEGARYPSPQALLDKLVGELSFDPLAFLEMEPPDQDKTLRRLAGIDTSALDTDRQCIFDERTIVNRDVRTLQATFDACEHFPDAPAEEISIDAITAEMKAARGEHTKAFDLDRAAEDAGRMAADAHGAVATNHTRIVEARRMLEELERHAEPLRAQAEAMETSFQAAKLKAEEARADVPDLDAIEAKIREANDTNEKVRANELRANVEKRLNARKANAAEATKEIEAFDARKAKMLAEAKFPIEGLGLSDDGPTFNGKLLAQASTAAKLRVSVAMGLALNPKLKVLLVHEGNDLDDDSLKLLGELAAAAGAQVWLERIAGNKDGVSILIEDGAVKSAGA